MIWLIGSILVSASFYIYVNYLHKFRCDRCKNKFKSKQLTEVTLDYYVCKDCMDELHKPV